MTRPSLLHYVSLDGAGGVELQFVEFLHAAARLVPAAHAVVACGTHVHPLVRARLECAHVPLDYEKYAGGLKLPKWPAAVRAAHQRRIVHRHRADAVIIWNRLRDSLNTLAAAGPERCIYWERGAAWFAGDSRAKRLFIDQIPAVLCNSFAARRMLELRWDYSGQIRIIPNALRPSLLPAAAVYRSLEARTPLRLGVAARLAPIKGVALAIHALAILRGRDVAVTLAIAGDGPERASLEALVRRLDLAHAVVFEGLVKDMRRFYQCIDILVHPALREPFGQIAVEANAYGVPAVVAAVDGLVEAIRHDETGVCVAPTLALQDYARLGGTTSDLPPYVYDPARDTIAAPKLVDPGDLADAIAALVLDTARYERLSRQAIKAARERFDFDRHVSDALAAVAGFIERGRLAEPPTSARSGS